jgi:DNA-binding PadR family transcriptional regulator
MASKDLVAASARPLVLALLARGESYGYALIDEIREQSGGALEWSEGMLYPVLHRLEAEGLIEAHWRSAPDSGRQRKYYRLRASGKKALAAERTAWLEMHGVLTRVWKLGPA